MVTCTEDLTGSLSAEKYPAARQLDSIHTHKVFGLFLV